MIKTALALTIALGTSATAQAAIVTFTIEGQLTGVQYDFVNGVVTNGSGGPASTALLAAAPLGSNYSFSYSYDTTVPATFNNFGGSQYANLPIDGSFTLGGTSFALPQSNVIVGSNGFGIRYSLFGNFPLGSTDRLAGFRGIDFTFEVSRSTAGGTLGTKLPTSVSLAEFPNQYARVRFANDRFGETGILFSISSIRSTVAAVPEPASWAMMLVGFAIVGAATRRGRRPITAIA